MNFFVLIVVLLLTKPSTCVEYADGGSEVFGSHCETTGNSCSLSSGLICSSQGRCTCKELYIWNDTLSACQFGDEYCQNIFEGFIFENETGKCVNHPSGSHYWHFLGNCKLHEACPLHSTCIENGMCFCDEGYDIFGYDIPHLPPSLRNRVCLKLIPVGGTCDFYNRCNQSTNSVCLEGTCQCLEPSSLDGNSGKCFAPLHASCDFGSPYRNDKCLQEYAYCKQYIRGKREEHFCKCDSFYEETDGGECAGAYREICLEDKHCLDGRKCIMGMESRRTHTWDDSANRYKRRKVLIGRCLKEDEE